MKLKKNKKCNAYGEYTLYSTISILFQCLSTSFQRQTQNWVVSTDPQTSILYFWYLLLLYTTKLIVVSEPTNFLFFFFSSFVKRWLEHGEETTANERSTSVSIEHLHYNKSSCIAKSKNRGSSVGEITICVQFLFFFFFLPYTILHIL